MTDEEIVLQWLAASKAYHEAPVGEKIATYERVLDAERQLIERFGPGKHARAYAERFPDSSTGWSEAKGTSSIR